MDCSVVPYELVSIWNWGCRCVSYVLFGLARLSVFPMEQHAVVCKDLFLAMGLCSFPRAREQLDFGFSKSFICFGRAFLFICAPHVPASYDMYSLPA